MKIAIIAHNGKKAEMVALLLEHRELLKNVKLVPTGTTGKHVERAGEKASFRS